MTTPCTPSGGRMDGIKPNLGTLEPLAEELGCPNLDCMSVDPADFEAVSLYYSMLATYADMKARAMRYRLAGDMEAALSAERACDATYQRLPKWARW